MPMAFEPLAGRQEVSERRHGKEFAEMVSRLAAEVYPQAERIRLVRDNLSSHTATAFYVTFPPERARRLTGRVGRVCPCAGAPLVDEHGCGAPSSPPDARLSPR